jgi:hypothetical protein
MACFWSLPEAGAGQGGSEAEPSGWYDQGSLSVLAGHYSKRSLNARLSADRPAGAREFEELATMDRSAKIFLPVRTVTWALDGIGDQG